MAGRQTVGSDRVATRLIGSAAVAAAALAVLAVMPASADPAGASPAPSSLNLTVREGDGAPQKIALLSCDPAGGSHPQAGAACDELRAVGGNFEQLGTSGVGPSPRPVCTMEYRPVTVSAHGRWEGHSVEFEKTFSNSCMLNSRTGVVFQF